MLPPPPWGPIYEDVGRRFSDVTHLFHNGRLGKLQFPSLLTKWDAGGHGRNYQSGFRQSWIYRGYLSRRIHNRQTVHKDRPQKSRMGFLRLIW